MEFHGALAVTVGVLVAGLHPSRAVADTCSALGGRTIADATITVARSVSAGDFTAPDGSIQRGLPAFCQVHGTAKPVPGSNIGFELWMPATSWNGKLEMFGNGGYSSAISYGPMANLLGKGYATLGTDTGHTGDDPVPFVQGAANREIIIDWGHRAVHESVANAKLVIAAFYGRQAQHAYFSGCSTGGHQALMEAQRYPFDFDGIIAGDPGNNRTHLTAGFLWQFIQNHPHGNNNPSAQIISNPLLPVLTNAAVAQCRGGDGGIATDDFLTDPRDCRFDPTSLLCRSGQDAATCVASNQVDALHKMYGGARDLRNGHVIYPGWPMGSEASGWNRYWSNPAIPTEPARANFWRYWVFNDPDWNWWTFDWDEDMQRTDDKLATILNAMDPDLTSFERHGGKLIEYHGFADPVVAGADSIDYYQRVVATRRSNGNPEAPELGEGQRGDDAGALRQTQAFYRLFMVPGMAHCGGGAGANVFDMQSALEEWVENAIAPDVIVATKYVDNDPAHGIAFTRPLCAYPALPRYSGAGNTGAAMSFACVRGERDRTQMPALEYRR